MDTTKLKQNLNDTAEAAKASARSVADLARDTGETLASEAGARAGRVAGAVRDAVTDRADAAKDTVATAGDRLADSLRNAAERVHDGGVPERVLHAVADRVGGAADSLRGHSAADLVTDLRSFASRHPGAFAAAAAVAGFALARYLQSSATSVRQIERRS
ncbi:MAG: hypothetical protein ACT4OK_20200 [Gemmobacter sp.]